MRKTHWENVYKTKDHKTVSWYQAVPDISLSLLDSIQASPTQSIVDIGCGASLLVDYLIERDFKNITLIDLSAEALAIVKARLGGNSHIPHYVSQDVTDSSWIQPFDIWHDRAVFHFLTDKSDRQHYMNNLKNSLTQNGWAIIGTFAIDGPTACSGLDIVQYDTAKMQSTLPEGLSLESTQSHIHTMPNGSTQAFIYFIIKHQTSRL